MHDENATFGSKATVTRSVFIVLSILLSAEEAGAFERIGSDWTYNPNLMGKSLEICITGAPSGAEQAIKDAAKVWEYPKFKFTFKANACSSGGQFPTDNGTNQIDFGPCR